MNLHKHDNLELTIKNVMAEVFKVSADEIKEDTSPHTIVNWDSMKHIDLILSLEEEFGIAFDNAEIPTLLNFRLIVETIEAYKESDK